MKSKRPGLQRRRFRQALGFAWEGFRYAWETQGNMRIHAGIAVWVLGLARWLDFDALRMAILVLTVGSVIGVEWINTSIERVVDLTTTRPHPLAGQAKDLAAGAVLWFALISVVVGALLFLPVVTALPTALWGDSPAHRLEVAGVSGLALLLIGSGLRRGSTP